MAETFNCPACGAPLETDGNETSIHCEYCGETVIVPANLRTPSAASSAPVQFAPPSDQASQPGNTGGRMAPTQVRQMMMSIRAGQVDDAARIFQAGTGVSAEMAQETISAIAGHLNTTNRILPAELAAMMMGAFAQSARGYSQPYQPAPQATPRRRRSGLGCLLVLVALIVVLYMGYTALSPKQIVAGLFSSNKSDPVRETALAPIIKIQTAIAPIINSGQSGGATPSGSTGSGGAILNTGSGQGGNMQSSSSMMKSTPGSKSTP